MGGRALVLGSAVKGTVTFAPMIHDSPKIHGLHEIIKSEVTGEQPFCFISASLQAGHGERVANPFKMPLGQCQHSGTHQDPAPSPQCPSDRSLTRGSQELCPQQQHRGESISGAQSTPQPVGHVSHHNPSPASPLTLVLLSRHSSEAMGGHRRGGPGGG